MYIQEDNEMLSTIPTVKEIDSVVMAMNSLSSPGPGGFSGASSILANPLSNKILLIAYSLFSWTPESPMVLTPTLLH